MTKTNTEAVEAVWQALARHGYLISDGAREAVDAALSPTAKNEPSAAGLEGVKREYGCGYSSLARAHIAALEARNARLEEQVREAYERCAKVADEAVEEGKRWKSPTRWTAASIALAIRSLTTEQTNG